MTDTPASAAPKREALPSQRQGNEADILDFGAALSVSEIQTAPPLTVGERIALGTHELRVTVAVCMTAAFIVMNGLVMVGLYLALRFDFRMIESNFPNYVPFISAEVIMSLLGATTIQLRAITFTMAKFLFANSSSNG